MNAFLFFEGLWSHSNYALNVFSLLTVKGEIRWISSEKTQTLWRFYVWTGLKAYRAKLQFLVIQARTPFFAVKECEVVIKQYVPQHCASVGVCQWCECVCLGKRWTDSFLLTMGENMMALSHHPVLLAWNWHIEPHIHAHTFIPQTGVLCGRHGNSGPPLFHLSHPLLPFMNLCNLFIWNWVLMMQSWGQFAEVKESSRSRREGGVG